MNWAEQDGMVCLGWKGMSGEKGRRDEPCRGCGAETGLQVGLVDYWDIRRSRLVLCPACGLTQLDPMLTLDDTVQGCYAYYMEESLRTDQREQDRNKLRNFRRGVLFAFSLKRKGINPAEILEIGPGSGYFCAGIRFLFPSVRITVMDVNTGLLKENREVHGYDTVEGMPDDHLPQLDGRFDLVIARDILEHVTDISAVLHNLRLYLSPGGCLHFITPNGREDVWKHIVTYTLTGQASELLINHVNYFDGAGLKRLLEKHGFIPIRYYTYGVKPTLKGHGWRMSERLMAPVSGSMESQKYISQVSSSSQSTGLSREQILDQWYIRDKVKWLTFLYAAYQHGNFLKINPVRNKGHEIYGLFRRV